MALRIAVVGTSCSGKTTLARRISARRDIPHIELDSIYWQANWTPLPVDEFRAAVAVEADRDEWVIDGNYKSVRDIIWQCATDVVWLNLPFLTVLSRAVSRTVRRVATQEELFNGNRERPVEALFSRDSIIWWVLRTHHGRTQRYRKLLQDGLPTGLNVHEVRCDVDVDLTLSDL